MLRGRKVRLEKPMAVTERRARTQGRTATLRVMAVVKYKILFAERPAPVVDGEQVQ